MCARVYVCVRARVCVCARVRAYVRGGVCVRPRARVFVCGCLRVYMRVCWCLWVSVLNQLSKRVGTKNLFLCTYIPVKYYNTRILFISMA